MWRVLQHKEPDDFVGATGEAHSVREFVVEAFRLVGITDWEKHVTLDEKNLRPSEVYNLRGGPSKAKRILGWEAKTRFKDLVRIMVEAEMQAVEETRPARGDSAAYGLGGVGKQAVQWGSMSPMPLWYSQNRAVSMRFEQNWFTLAI